VREVADALRAGADPAPAEPAQRVAA